MPTTVIPFPAILKLTRELGRQQLTRLVAHSVWEHRGGPTDNWQDWFDAERIVPEGFWDDVALFLKNPTAELARDILTHLVYYAEVLERIIHAPWPPAGLFHVALRPRPGGVLHLRLAAALPRIDCGVAPPLVTDFPFPIRLSRISLGVTDGSLQLPETGALPDLVLAAADGFDREGDIDLDVQPDTAASGETVLLVSYRIEIERHPADRYLPVEGLVASTFAEFRTERLVLALPGP